jgi:hypothetical protein
MDLIGRAANFSFAIIVEGKRALSVAKKGKEKGQWARAYGLLEAIS